MENKTIEDIFNESKDLIKKGKLKAWKEEIKEWLTTDPLKINSLYAFIDVMRKISKGETFEKAFYALYGHNLRKIQACKAIEAVAIYHEKGEEFLKYCENNFKPLYT